MYRSTQVRRIRLTSLFFALVLALAAPAARADAPGVVQIVGPDGRVLVRSDVLAGWSYPEDGSLVQIADAVRGGGELRLVGVSVLGGRIYADGLALGRGPRADALSLEGAAAGDVAPNTPVLLPGAGWAMLLQQAVIPSTDGHARRTTVLLRVHLDVAHGSLPAGSEILIGYVAGNAAIGGPARLSGAAADIPAELVPLYRAAGVRYGVPWSVLAAIGKVESDHGRSNEAGVHSGVNSYGCCAGPMQFSIPPAYDTWGAYAVDGDGDGVKSVYDPADAIPAAARLLATNGARRNLAAAVYTYNHAWWYVQRVLELAKAYEQGARLPAPVDPAAAVSRAGTRRSPGIDPVTLG